MPFIRQFIYGRRQLRFCVSDKLYIMHRWSTYDRSINKQINKVGNCIINWAASSEFGIYRLCEQRRFRRACASAQSRQNLRCSLIQAVSQEEPSDRKPDPWSLQMAGHAQLEFFMTGMFEDINSLDAAQFILY